MIYIGRRNHLRVNKIVDFGVYLDAQALDNILLPKRYVPEGCKIGDSITVFIYADSDDLLIATTEIPKVMVGECALLEVLETNKVGAFLDWGLPKDLLVPFNEQHKPMQAGNHYVVYVALDEHSDRIVASSRLSRHLDEYSHNDFKPKQAVELLICGKSELGFKAVINNTHLGLIYHDDVFQPLKYGQSITGYIKEVRPDKKINLTLQLGGQRSRDDLTDKILAHLRAQGGISTITDASTPDVIYKTFHTSKKNYKKALGALYKQRVISIEKHQVTLLSTD